MPYLINERYHKYAENILSLSFKGERTYLHGTDIFPSLLKITGPIKNLSIQFHKTTSKKLKLHFLKPSDVAEFRKCNDLCVLMIFTRLGNREVILITETKKKEANPLAESKKDKSKKETSKLDTKKEEPKEKKK